MKRAGGWLCLALALLIGVKWLAIIARGFADQALRLQLFLQSGLAMRDPHCATPFGDTSLFWLAGRLARYGAMPILYNAARFHAYTLQNLPHQTEFIPFIYPPTALPAMAAMSFVPLLPAYFGFIAACLIVSVLLLRWARISWVWIALGLLSPAAIWAMYLGQFGLICGVVLVCGLARLDDSPVKAGALLAVLCVKPQYALLVPIAVIASRNVRAVAAGAGGVAAFVALATAWFGWPAWAGFLGPGAAAMRALLEAPFPNGYEATGISVFWSARSFNAGLTLAYAIQAGATAFAIIWTWQVWRNPAIDHAVRVATTVFLSLLASPYVYTEDMIGFSLALGLLARRDTPARNVLLAGLWLAPAYSGHIAEKFGVLVMPFCVAAAVAAGWRGARTLPREVMPLIMASDPSTPRQRPAPP